MNDLIYEELHLGTVLTTELDTELTVIKLVACIIAYIVRINLIIEDNVNKNCVKRSRFSPN